MKIAIVNDLPLATVALQNVLQMEPSYQLIWTAKNGSEAIARCAEELPDLILMDLLMPVLDGVEATRQIIQKFSCAILVVTCSTEKNLDRVYEAMCYGALDAVDTPSLRTVDQSKSAQTLLAKIATIQKLLQVSPRSRPSQFRPSLLSWSPKSPRSNGDRPPPIVPKTSPPITPKINMVRRPHDRSIAPPLIAIGASTGGPKALATILSKLPVGFGAAVVVVQHVDAHFSAGLVSWLDRQLALPIRVAQAGDVAEAGMILVAGRNDHLYLTANRTLAYKKDPIDYPYRPSVDVFFNSLADYWIGRGTAILLTGMGRDGAKGLGELRSRQWQTIAQNRESCVVYGMPKAAAELHAASDILSPDEIATMLLRKYATHRP